MGWERGRRHKSKRKSAFFFQAGDGIRDIVRSRGLGDVYKRRENRFLGKKIDLQLRLNIKKSPDFEKKSSL